MYIQNSLLSLYHVFVCACKRWMKTKRHQFNVSEGSVLILLCRHSDVPRYVFFCYHGPIVSTVCVCGVYVCLQWCTSLCFCQWSDAPTVVTTRLWYRRRLPSYTSRHNWNNLRTRMHSSRMPAAVAVWGGVSTRTPPPGPAPPRDQAPPRPGTPPGTMHTHPGTMPSPGNMRPPREQNHTRLWKYNLAPTSLRAVKIRQWKFQ